MKTQNSIENVQTAEVVKTKKVRAKKVVAEVIETAVVAEVAEKNVVAETIAETIAAKKKRKSDRKKLFLFEGILYNVSLKKLSAAKLIFKNDEVALKNYVVANSHVVKFSERLFLSEGILFSISNKKLSAAKLIFKNDESALQTYVLENSKKEKFSEKF